MPNIIQLRRDTGANWNSVNPTLTQGEIGINLTTGQFKIGDGTTAWSSLSYFEIASAWGGITGTLSNQTDLQNALNARVPTIRTLTINGTALDLSADRSWTITAGVWGQITGTLSSQTDLQLALDAKQNALSGTGFVTISGTTISYDNTSYTPTSRTLTINGTTLDLSANRSWTIPAISSLNSQTGATQTFATGTTGTDFAISSSSNTHTFNIPDAGASARGLITTGTQTIAGAKTLTGDTVVSGVFRPRMATNRQTASYTLVLADEGKTVEMNVASANNLTVPPNSSVAFPVGSQILITQYGAGQTTIVAGAGVTLRSDAGKLKITTQYSGVSLIKIGTDEWYVFGNLSL